MTPSRSLVPDIHFSARLYIFRPLLDGRDNRPMGQATSFSGVIRAPSPRIVLDACGTRGRLFKVRDPAQYRASNYGVRVHADKVRR